MRFLQLLVAGACLLYNVASAHGQASAPPTASAAVAAVTFQPGDAVRITVWRNPELSGEFEVGEDGTILHPLYRAVHAGGLSAVQVESRIRGVLERFESNPELIVEPLFKVVISGEVRSPNVYALSPATSVLQAIAQAGGATTRANTSRVRLLRDGRTIPIDISVPGDELSQWRIRSGDQIVLDVRRDLWNDRVRPVVTTIGSVASIVLVFVRYRQIR